MQYFLGLKPFGVGASIAAGYAFCCTVPKWFSFGFCCLDIRVRGDLLAGFRDSQGALGIQRYKR